MTSRGDRFRQLRTPGTADLFEHFGVAALADPPAPEPTPVAFVAAAACEHCGWYRPLPMAGACPLCGAPGREGLRTPQASELERAAKEGLRTPQASELERAAKEGDAPA